MAVIIQYQASGQPYLYDNYTGDYYHWDGVNQQFTNNAGQGPPPFDPGMYSDDDLWNMVSSIPGVDAGQAWQRLRDPSARAAPPQRTPPTDSSGFPQDPGYPTLPPEPPPPQLPPPQTPTQEPTSLPPPDIPPVEIPPVDILPNPPPPDDIYPQQPPATTPATAGTQPRTSFSVPIPLAPFPTTGSFEDQAERNRRYAHEWATGLDTGFRDYAQYQEGLENLLQEQLFSGPGGWGEILGGGGGLTEQELKDILGEDFLAAALPSDADLTSLRPTEDEQAAMIGDAWEPRNVFRDRVGGLGDLQGEATKRQREAYTNLTERLDSAIDPKTLSMREGYGEDAAGALYGLAEGYADVLDPDLLTSGEAYKQSLLDPARAAGAAFGEILDPSRLTVGPEYRASLLRSVGDLSNRYKGAVDPAQLGLSEDFLRAYNVSERDIQNLRDKAAFGVQAGSQAQQEALDRAAFSAGNTNPLALAAARARIQRDANSDAAKAALEAEIAGKNLLLNTAQAREGMRLDSARDLSNRGIQTATNIADRELQSLQEAQRLGLISEQDYARLSAELMQSAAQMETQALTEAERARIGSQQEFAGLGFRALEGLTDRGLNQLESQEQMRLGTARDISDRMANAAVQGQTARLATEKDIRNQQQELGQYNLNNLTDLTKYAEAEGTRRQTERINTNADRNAQIMSLRYGMYMPASQESSKRASDVANTRLNTEREGRTFLTDYQQRAQQAAADARANRLNTASVATSGVNEPMRALAAMEANPRLWERIARTATGAASAAAGLL